MSFSSRQVVEIFHLTFLRALLAKGDDKGLIALKGGCNLRFFFGSVRYSEDMDLDVVVIARETLKNKIDRLLKSPLVLAPLKSKGIAIEETSAPKQTETTQRWKVALRVDGFSGIVRTKVEFSRRGAIEGAKFEAIDRDVLRPYGLMPVLATHYDIEMAIVQKIHALAERAEPQARDIFDLNLLFARPEAAKFVARRVKNRWLSNAIEHALSISFDDYTSKVVAYLELEQADLFSGRSFWNTIQGDVVNRLEALR